MELHKPGLLNKVAKSAARPLSRFVCASFVQKPVRALDAYLNFLLGKGSGTGWDLEHEINAALSRIYRERPVVFDVGANVGLWSKCLLNLKPSARLFLFEPSPECVKQIASLNLPVAKIISSAVGEAASKAFLHFSSETDGSASLHARGDSYFRDRIYQSVEVAVTTIDQVIADERIDFVDFLKMDIEGHELAALRGAAQALASRKIGALSFEFGSGNINSRTYFRDFWGLLDQHGFSIYRVTPSGQLLYVEDYYEDCEYFRGATNYVAQLRKHPYQQLNGVSKAAS